METSTWAAIIVIGAIIRTSALPTFLSSFSGKFDLPLQKFPRSPQQSRGFFFIKICISQKFVVLLHKFNLYRHETILLSISHHFSIGFLCPTTAYGFHGWCYCTFV